MPLNINCWTEMHHRNSMTGIEHVYNCYICTIYFLDIRIMTLQPTVQHTRAHWNKPNGTVTLSVVLILPPERQKFGHRSLTPPCPPSPNPTLLLLNGQLEDMCLSGLTHEKNAFLSFPLQNMAKYQTEANFRSNRTFLSTRRTKERELLWAGGNICSSRGFVRVRIARPPSGTPAWAHNDGSSEWPVTAPSEHRYNGV